MVRTSVVRTTLMLLLTLVMALGGTAAVLAQDATSGNGSSGSAIFLPFINRGQPSAQSADTNSGSPTDAAAEENLTDATDAVNAAGAGSDGIVFVTSNANDPVRGNEVVMYRRGADGMLTLAGRFPTGGQGLGAGLGSQGALLLSGNGRWLFTVNAGSNEISSFAVQPAGLILTDKVASGGIRPTSLTVRHNLLYVLNAGDPGNITGFKLSEEGKLTPLANSTRPLSNNGAGAAPAPAQVSFTPDGNSLVVTERGTNFIDLYRVNKQGVAAGPTVQNSAGVTPFGFAFARFNALVVSEAFGGTANGSAVSSYQVDGDQLRLVSGSVPTGETAACWIAIAGGGRFAYSTNAGSASISAYEVGDGGRLTLLNGRAGLTGDGTGPADPAVSHNERWLYALSPRSQTIIGFAVGVDGSLVSVGSFGGLSGSPAGIAAW